ncbi:MAG: methyltransferase domain-containing protein [Candidatus Paceibacterota bacterium]
MNKDLVNTILNKNIDDYNVVAEKYSQVREKTWKEMDFLFDGVEAGDNVLDLGCGNGRFYNEFISRGAEYWGIDSSKKLIEIAGKNHPEARFGIGDAFNIPFEAEFFDKVYAIAVLHHIPSVEARLLFLKEAQRVLSPNGYLILSVWDLKEKRKKRKFNFLTWFWELGMDKGDILLPWYGVKDAYFHAFDLPELVGLIESAGLKIIKKGEIKVGEKPYNNFYVIAQKV